MEGLAAAATPAPHPTDAAAPPRHHEGKEEELLAALAVAAQQQLAGHPTPVVRDAVAGAAELLARIQRAKGLLAAGIRALNAAQLRAAIDAAAAIPYETPLVAREGGQGTNGGEGGLEGKGAGGERRRVGGCHTDAVFLPPPLLQRPCASSRRSRRSLRACRPPSPTATPSR